MRISFNKKKYKELLKTHWFTTAIIVMLMFAVFKQKTKSDDHTPRRNPVITNPDSKGFVKPQKYTDVEELGQGSLFGKMADKNESKKFARPTNKESVAFLKRFGKVVVAEKKKYGIPASVLLATAYVNSYAGTRDCATKANNYFALSCQAVRGEQYQEAGKCKLKVKTAWESFRAFSLLLQAQPWIKQAKADAGNNWEAWLPVLAEHHISDVPNYEEEARNVIETFNLQELDRP